MSGGGQGMGYGSQGGYGGGYGGQSYGGYGGQSYGGQQYGNQYGGQQYSQSQYNPQRSYQSYGPPPMASGETQYTLGSQQHVNGVRAGGGAGGVSGLPYQPAGGMMQQRQVTQAQGPGMNTGGNMMPQAPMDSRGIAPPTASQTPNTIQQTAPISPSKPAWQTPGWVNPMFQQSNNAYAAQPAAPGDTSGQGMGGQPFTGQKAYPEGYQFESVPSTLDPGSMNVLQAWMGGSNSPFGPNLGQQQQGYTNWYNQTYGQQAPGGPRRY